MCPAFLPRHGGRRDQTMVDHTAYVATRTEMARERSRAELIFLNHRGLTRISCSTPLNSVYFLIDKNNTRGRGALPKFSTCYATSYMK